MHGALASGVREAVRVLRETEGYQHTYKHAHKHAYRPTYKDTYKDTYKHTLEGVGSAVRVLRETEGDSGGERHRGGGLERETERQRDREGPYHLSDATVHEKTVTQGSGGRGGRKGERGWKAGGLVKSDRQDERWGVREGGKEGAGEGGGERGLGRLKDGPWFAGADRRPVWEMCDHSDCASGSRV